MDRYIVISIGVMAVIALVTVGMGSEGTIVGSSSCDQTPSGNVEHCTRDADQGGGASAETPAGTQAGVGGQDISAGELGECTGGSGFHEGAPNSELVGSGANGLRNCD